jgi:hypothetical protein
VTSPETAPDGGRVVAAIPTANLAKETNLRVLPGFRSSWFLDPGVPLTKWLQVGNWN